LQARKIAYFLYEPRVPIVQNIEEVAEQLLPLKAAEGGDHLYELSEG
jgi:hypothetical protein